MHTRKPASIPCERQSGFTLIELLVVMALILVMVTIGAAFIPAAMDSQKTASGASQLQNWLTIARQQALLDRAPRGLRMIVDTTAGSITQNNITSAQYIAQPDDFTGGTVQSTATAAGVWNLSKLTVAGVDPTNGSANTLEYSVQVGDFIQLQGGGLVHQISAVTATSLTLLHPLLSAVTMPTSYYRIIRQPRVLGEEPMLLPAGIGVDLKTDTTTAASATPYNFAGANSLPAATANTNGSIDILFSPNGEVINYTKSNSYIVLWVRDFNYASPFQNEPTLIAVFVRSGLVAAYPVDPPPGATPYTLIN